MRRLVGAGAAAGCAWFAPADPWIIMPAVLMGAWVVLARAQCSLSVTHAFPELERIALLGRLLG